MVDMLTSQYKAFSMKKSQMIQEMHTRFTSIINELYIFYEVNLCYKEVRKILGVLSMLWGSKVDTICDAGYLKTFTMDELIGNLKTHELKK